VRLLSSLRALIARPGLLFALATVVVVVAVTVGSGPGAVASGLVGSVVGLLIAHAALQLGMLLGAVLCGARVHRLVIGAGSRLWERTSPRRTVVVRALPIVLSVAVGPGRRPVRPRMWGAGVVSALAGVAAAVVLVVLAADPFWTGAAAGAVATVLHTLIPRETAGSTSTGWVLLNLLRLTGERAARLDAAPLVDQALDALNAGDVDTAEQVADRLAREFPELRSATYTRVSVLEARGRYAEALSLSLGLMQAPDTSQKDAALTLAGMAGLAAAAVEAKQLPAEMGLPVARRALEDAVAMGYPRYKTDGTRALLALLEGDAETAVQLARSGAESGDHLLSRADDLATLARAHMANGDNRAARAALAEAEKLAPWWPRVAATRARLEVR